MSPHTVALQGHNGRTGSAALKALSAAHGAGKIKLVVVHRPGSDVSTIPPGVEARQVDLGQPNAEEIKRAIEGVNVYL